MKTPTRTQADQAARSFYDLMKLCKRQEGLILDYMAHPDASANEIMELRDKLVESRKYSEAMREHLHKHMGNYWSFKARQQMDSI